MYEELLKMTIKEDITIKDALKRMDSVGKKVLFVVGDDHKLFGTVTDGDVRRWILKDGSLLGKVSQIYNKTPKIVKEDYSLALVRKMMLSERIESIPVINADGKLVKSLLWDSVFSEHDKKNGLNLKLPVVIMAGGRGERLDPFTRILPKPLIPLGEKPIVELIMDNFAEYGCSSFYLVLNYKAKMIQAYFEGGNTDYNINYICEDRVCGTIGGLSLAAEKLDAQNIFVSNCDILVKTDYSDILNFHTSSGYDMTLVGCIQHLSVPYGVLEMQNGGDLCNIIEKPEYDLLVNTGMYILKREVIEHIPKNVEYDFTDLINKIRSLNGKVGIYPITQQSWIDIGQMREYNNVLKKFE